MDTLTFIAEALKATSWPIAAFGIALVFRKQIRDLLARVKKGKIAGTEFEFEQEVRELVAEKKSGPALPPPQIPTHTISLATSNPRAAILEAWLKLEDSAYRLAKSRNLTFEPGPLPLLHALKNTGALSEEDYRLFQELRKLRNQATHAVDFSPSAEAVIRYVQFAQGLAEKISNASAGR